LSPQLSRASQDDWETHWDRYAESAAQNPAQQMRHEIVARLLAQADRKEAMRIFDLGSGQGDLARKLKRLLPEAEFVGAELSQSGVAISRRKVPNATFLVADILHPPSELDQLAGWATHAICSEVLEHLDDPKTFLERASRYLQPGGRLIVTVPGGPISAFDRHIGHRQHFDRRRIQSLLERAGYCVDRTYLAGFPFFNLYRLVVIARGERLARDVDATVHGVSSAPARVAMKLFGALFHANFLDSPFGWQVVATARKAST
jgi:SAM-dependent methyltransferase